MILTYPENNLWVDDDEQGERHWRNQRVVWRGARQELRRDQIVYVQLEPRESEMAGVPERHEAVSISLEPRADGVNLAGRVRRTSHDTATPCTGDPRPPRAGSGQRGRPLRGGTRRRASNSSARPPTLCWSPAGRPTSKSFETFFVWLSNE